MAARVFLAHLADRIGGATVFLVSAALALLTVPIAARLATV